MTFLFLVNRIEYSLDDGPGVDKECKLSSDTVLADSGLFEFPNDKDQSEDLV